MFKDKKSETAGLTRDLLGDYRDVVRQDEAALNTVSCHPD
jgi:hypothetical protein